MSLKKSIGWCDMTLNPIKGRCKGGCWYCYYSGKRGMLNRFTQDPEIRLDISVFDRLPKKPKKIFLCSTHDLFGGWISESKREIIFEKIRYCPQHTFQILTKFPENIDGDIPDNVWLGISITGSPNEEQFNRGFDLFTQEAKIKFISFEPILYPINESLLDNLCGFDWIIVGRLTGYGKDCDPPKWWINEIVKVCKRYKIPIFMKDNLKEIWGEKLIQEMPKEGDDE